MVNGVHLASCRVAGSNLGCGNFKCYVIFLLLINKGVIYKFY